LIEGDVIIKLRLRWTDNHLYPMPEILEGPTQVFQINPLTAAMRIAAVA
jgi:hypothetical protein